MECTTHPGVMAIERCAGCAEPFCGNCLVQIKGQQYCGSCKVLAVQDTGTPAAAVGETKLCPEAKNALILSLVGLICFGIILEPLALVKAFKAKKNIAADPSLTGDGMATAAIVVASIGLILWVLGVIARISQV